MDAAGAPRFHVTPNSDAMALVHEPMRLFATAAAVLALTSVTRANPAEPPATVKPFLTGEESGVLAVTGAFGPAKDTTLVVTFDLHGAGSYHGFALVPDKTAAHGFAKLALPALPTGAELGSDHDGEMSVALVANLDNTPADEVVLQLAVVCCAGARGSWMGVTYVVLAWTGDRFARARGFESKLEHALAAKDAGMAMPLTDAELRAALHVR